MSSTVYGQLEEEERDSSGGVLEWGGEWYFAGVVQLWLQQTLSSRHSVKPQCRGKQGKRPMITHCFAQYSNGCSLGSLLFLRQDNHVQRCTMIKSVESTNQRKHASIHTCSQQSEEGTVRKGGIVGQLCPSTETGTVQSWTMVDSCCPLYSLNQAINDYHPVSNRESALWLPIVSHSIPMGVHWAACSFCVNTIMSGGVQCYCTTNKWRTALRHDLKTSFLATAGVTPAQCPH